MPYNNYMQGGMFGPMGGSQNIGGMGQMSERELAMLLGSMQGNSPTGGSLPNYSTPRPPQQAPGIGTTGIDPSMMAGAAEGGLQGMNMNPAGDSMGGMQDAIMDFGARKLEEERLRKLLAASAPTPMVDSGKTAFGEVPGPKGAHAWTPDIDNKRMR